MTPQQIEAMKLALEALEKCRTYHQQDWSSEETTKPEVKQAITAIKEALAQTQEPVGRFTGKFTVDAHDRMLCEVVCMGAIPTAGAALYTTPPQSTEQEPFCLHWEDRWGCNHYADPKEPHPVNAKPLYTTPPQRTWVGLTDEELADCMDMSIQKTCRAIEAKLKEKNGYAEEKK